MKTEKYQYNHSKEKSSWFSISRLTALIIIIIIGYYLITEHKAHIGGFLDTFPWWILLLLLCPLMHFMHGKHGDHGKHKEHHHHENDDENSPEKKE